MTGSLAAPAFGPRLVRGPWQADAIETTGARGAGIRVARADDRREVLASAARAFTVDPLFGYFSRDRLSGHRMLPGLLGGTVADLLTHGTCWVAEADEHGTPAPVGFAGWYPPDGFPRPLGREAALAARSLPASVRIRHPGRGLRLFFETERVHPHEPHWYLALLAVDPDWQGRGLGGALLRPGLERADDEGLPCYLETQKEANLAFYGRYGFEPTHTIRLRHAPPVWCMTRPAR